MKVPPFDRNVEESAMEKGSQVQRKAPRPETAEHVSAWKKGSGSWD